MTEPGLGEREASSAAFYAALIDVSLGNALTARQVVYFRSNLLPLRTGETLRLPACQCRRQRARSRFPTCGTFAYRPEPSRLYPRSYTSLHTTPLTRSKTPPRAPASTYPPRKRPARPGAPRPTALQRTCPQLHRGSPLPRVHGPTLPMKQTRPDPPRRPIPVKRARRPLQRNTHTKSRPAPLNASRTCARDGD